MDLMLVIKHQFGVLIILNKPYIYLIMNKTPFQKFIDQLEKNGISDKNIIEMAKKFQTDERYHVNRIYETGVFHGEFNKPKKFDFYGHNFSIDIKQFTSNS